MRQIHSQPPASGAWMVGLIVFAVVASLWMAWRLGGLANVQDVRLHAPSLPAQAMPNPQPVPSPASPTPR